LLSSYFFFFFPTTATTDIYTLSLHDALPISFRANLQARNLAVIVSRNVTARDAADKQQPYNLHVTGSTTQKVAGSSKLFDIAHLDRKSTRLNSSHVEISYAVFCLKKKKKIKH